MNLRKVYIFRTKYEEFCKWIKSKQVNDAQGWCLSLWDYMRFLKTKMWSICNCQRLQEIICKVPYYSLPNVYLFFVLLSSTINFTFGQYFWHDLLHLNGGLVTMNSPIWKLTLEWVSDTKMQKLPFCIEFSRNSIHFFLCE